MRGGWVLRARRKAEEHWSRDPVWPHTQAAGQGASTGPFPAAAAAARGRLSIISIEMIAETVCRKVDVSQSGTTVVDADADFDVLALFPGLVIPLSACMSACPSRSHRLTHRSQAVCMNVGLLGSCYKPVFPACNRLTVDCFLLAVSTD